MTDSTYSEMLTRIYAAFGKNAPSETSPVYTFLFKRVAFIEDSYCDGIAAAIEGYDKAPTNVGVAILNEYNKLKPENTGMERQCPYCYNNTGFIFFVHPTYSSPRGYAAKCPHCNGGNNAEIAYQMEQGAKIVPADKFPRLYWGECYGEWVPPARTKEQDRQATGTGTNTATGTGTAPLPAGTPTVPPTDGNKTPVAGHFTAISQAADNLTDALEDFWKEA